MKPVGVRVPDGAIEPGSPPIARAIEPHSVRGAGLTFFTLDPGFGDTDATRGVAAAALSYTGGRRLQTANPVPMSDTLLACTIASPMIAMTDWSLSRIALHTMRTASCSEFSFRRW